MVLQTVYTQDKTKLWVFVFFFQSFILIYLHRLKQVSKHMPRHNYIINSTHAFYLFPAPKQILQQQNSTPFGSWKELKDAPSKGTQTTYRLVLIWRSCHPPWSCHLKLTENVLYSCLDTASCSFCSLWNWRVKLMLYSPIYRQPTDH